MSKFESKVSKKYWKVKIFILNNTGDWDEIFTGFFKIRRMEDLLIDPKIGIRNEEKCK